MVKGPELEREDVGGREPMGDPAETDPSPRRGLDDDDTELEPDEELTEGAPGRRVEPERIAP